MKHLTTSHVFVCIFILYLMGFLAHALYLDKTVYGDGLYYFSWLRSVSVDHDINFTNEYQALGGTQPLTHQGLPGNKYSIGPALLWAPAYHGIRAVTQGDGYAFIYQLGVGVSSVLLAVFGLVLIFRILPGPQPVKLLTILLLAFATNLFFYGSVDSVNSHALSFFAACVYLSLLVVNPVKNWWAVGLALALLGLIRIQDLIFALLLVPHIKSIHWGKLIAGFAIGLTPQLVAWYALYGNFRTNPYLAGGEKFTLMSPHLLGVLTNKDSGLLLWTPVFLIGVVGLWVHKPYRWYLAVVLLQFWLVASWSTWWQGASYSGRMFVSVLPLVALGLSHIMTRVVKIVGVQVACVFVATLALLNSLAIVYFLLTH